MSGNVSVGWLWVISIMHQAIEDGIGEGGVNTAIPIRPMFVSCFLLHLIVNTMF